MKTQDEIEYDLMGLFGVQYMSDGLKAIRSYIGDLLRIELAQTVTEEGIQEYRPAISMIDVDRGDQVLKDKTTKSWTVEYASPQFLVVVRSLIITDIKGWSILKTKQLDKQQTT